MIEKVREADQTVRRFRDETSACMGSSLSKKRDQVNRVTSGESAVSPDRP
jgi:hypothetical protein